MKKFLEIRAKGYDRRVWGKVSNFKASLVQFMPKLTNNSTINDLFREMKRGTAVLGAALSIQDSASYVGWQIFEKLAKLRGEAIKSCSFVPLNMPYIRLPTPPKICQNHNHSCL